MGIVVNGITLDTSQLSSALQKDGVNAAAAAQEVALVEKSKTDVYVPADRNQATTLTLYGKNGQLIATEQLKTQSIQPSQEVPIPPGLVRVGVAVGNAVLGWVVGKTLDFIVGHGPEILKDSTPMPILYPLPFKPPVATGGPDPGVPVVAVPAPPPPSTPAPTPIRRQN